MLPPLWPADGRFYDVRVQDKVEEEEKVKRHDVYQSLEEIVEFSTLLVCESVQDERLRQAKRVAMEGASVT